MDTQETLDGFVEPVKLHMFFFVEIALFYDLKLALPLCS